MYKKESEEKQNFRLKMLKEVGYILLLITFFVGIIIGTINFRNVEESSFDEYESSLNENLIKIEKREASVNTQKSILEGIKIILLFWLIGMSIIGTPILIFLLGYKGYSIGYTISAILRIMGLKSGYKMVFQILFLKNVVLVFVMICLANFSIKISENFLKKKPTLKADTIKYTVFSAIALATWLTYNIVFAIF